jgi:Phosphatidylserine/phosphatidylglycerophosphate/cardiolipin synthases and related enzymes
MSFLSLLILPLFLSSAKVEVFFSATDGCKDKIIKSINSAQKSIKIAIYHITSREIMQALIDAKKRGLDIKIVADGEQAKDKFSKVSLLIKEGIDVKITDYSTRKKRFLTPKMHHKFMIIDRKYVMTGSFNFTASAEELNDENCVFIYDSVEVVEKFEREFERLWKISQ